MCGYFYLFIAHVHDNVAPLPPWSALQGHADMVPITSLVGKEGGGGDRGGGEEGKEGGKRGGSRR